MKTHVQSTKIRLSHRDCHCQSSERGRGESDFHRYPTRAFPSPSSPVSFFSSYASSRFIVHTHDTPSKQTQTHIACRYAPRHGGELSVRRPETEHRTRSHSRWPTTYSVLLLQRRMHRWRSAISTRRDRILRKRDRRAGPAARRE